MNYLALLVAAIAAFAVGALWYGPLFGKPWRALMNIPEGAPGMGSMKMPPMQAMVGGFIATLVLTFVLSMFIGAFGVTTALGAVVLAVWIWLGFIASVMLNSVFYEGRPWKLYFINASHYLVALVVAALILALW